MVKLFEVTTQPISVDEVSSRIADPENGAVVTFAGVVRNDSEGRRVSRLEYEAYPEMAEDVLHQIAGEIRTRWSSVWSSNSTLHARSG